MIQFGPAIIIIACLFIGLSPGLVSAIGFYVKFGTNKEKSTEKVVHW